MSEHRRHVMSGKHNDGMQIKSACRRFLSSALPYQKLNVLVVVAVE